MSTTVTGTLKDLATNTVASGSFVRAYLRGTGGNQPRVNGSAIIPPRGSSVWYVDFAPNSSGVISGSLFSTRDAAGTGDGEIEVGGSLTAVWFGIVVVLNGVPGPELPVHTKDAATLDLTNVTPITTPPVVTAPTGDSTYLQLSGGNGPVTGLAEFTAGTKVTNAGVFTNTQMNEYAQSIINSASPLTEFQALQGNGHFSTDALTGAMAVPDTSTVYGANGVAGYVSSASTTTNAVGSYGQFRALAASVKGWGGNFVADDGGHACTMIGLEVDGNPTNTSTAGGALSVSGAFTGNPTSFPAITVGAPVGGGTWSQGLLTKDGASVTGVSLGAQGTGTSQASQNIALNYRDSGGTSHQTSIGVSSTGQINLNPTSGQAVSTSEHFQSPNYSTNSANLASAGQIRLASNDAIGIRNNANSADIFLGKNSSDQMIFGSSVVSDGTHANGLTIASGTSTLTSNATLGAVTSQTAITTTATGALTTDAIEWSYASAPGSGDALCHVSAYATSGNVNFVRSNPTAAAQNVSAIVINWRIVR
jgi:hypothetical protein